MNTHVNFWIFGISLILIISNCSLVDDQIMIGEDRIVDNSAALNDRITLMSDTIEVVFSNEAGRGKGKDFELILAASLASPTLDGQKLQATSIVDYQGGFFTTYNFRGDPYHGGIDFVGSNLSVRSQVIYKKSNINNVAFEKNDIYIVGSTESEGVPAFIESIELKGNNFQVDNVKQTFLGGFAANSVVKINDGLLVTTGDNAENGGGLYYVSDDLKILGYVALHDARWVLSENDVAYVGQGTPGKISIVDLSNMSVVNSYNFDGAYEPEAKTTIELADGRLFVAGGPQGLLVLDANNGSLLHQLMFDSQCTTDAVSAEKGMLFISNGEGGAFVATYDDKNIQKEPELIGKLQFAENESVNHILYRSNMLYVASGLGGTKVVKIVK